MLPFKRATIRGISTSFIPKPAGADKAATVRSSLTLKPSHLARDTGPPNGLFRTRSKTLDISYLENKHDVSQTIVHHMCQLDYNYIGKNTNKTRDKPETHTCTA